MKKSMKKKELQDTQKEKWRTKKEEMKKEATMFKTQTKQERSMEVSNNVH
jgi:hypothetical protein